MEYRAFIFSQVKIDGALHCFIPQDTYLSSITFKTYVFMSTTLLLHKEQSNLARLATVHMARILDDKP